MIMTTGPLILPALETDSALAQRTVKRVMDWDAVTPDPFRDRAAAKTKEIQQKFSELNKSLKELPKKIQNDPSIVKKAQDAENQAEFQLKVIHAKLCGPGTLLLISG